MSVIRNILEEERERLSKLLEKYKKEIEKLPRGSISKKIRNGKWYLYRAYREKKSVKFEYIGKESSLKAQEIDKQIQKRKKYQSLIAEVRRDLS